MIACPACGEENPDRFRLCGYCGAALVPPAPVQEIRKTVTIVFSDLQGSTSLGERLDAESLRELMTRYFDAMRAELEAHGGTIEKFIGDAIMAVFGLPTVHEDDALRAVRAAASMRAALRRLNDELQPTYGVRLVNRTGVHTGEVVAGDPSGGQRLVTGDPVNTAARLETAAPPDGILLGPLTYRLVRDHVDATPVDPLALKGKAERTAAWELIDVRREPRGSRRFDGPMIGREQELAAIQRALDAAIRDGCLHSVTILGDAGLGKSRLVREALRAAGAGVQVLRGRCLPYGAGITFWPIVEIVRAAADIAEDATPQEAAARLRATLGDDDVADRIEGIASLSTREVPLAESFWAVGRMLHILAAGSPLVVVIDDIHWAEPTLLELIEHLVTTGAGTPCLVLCTARPDLLEGRPDWGTRSREDRVMLWPLAPADAGQLLDALLGGSGLSSAVRDRVATTAEGNPLYVEQFVSMLVDEGVARLEDGRWWVVDSAAELAVPPSVQALIEARLDRLAHDERAVIEPASVVGLVFQPAAVRWLMPEHGREALPERLAGLQRRHMVQATPEPIDEPDYRFHHILIRDAAYASLLKRTRAELHERFVEWAESRHPGEEAPLELEEVLGWHLEQAHRYRTELAPLDPRAVALGIRASERLEAAGRRAHARGDVHATLNLLGRAAGTRPLGDPRRARLLVETGDALVEAGDLAEAERTFRTAKEEATSSSGEPGIAAAADLGLIGMHYLTEGGDEQGVTNQVQASIATLEAASDHRGLARAWRLLTNIHFAACRYLDATVAVERMIDEARRAGDRLLELRVLPALATCAQLGPMRVPDAITLIEGVLRELEGDRKSEAYTLRALANLEAMRGRPDQARALYRRSRQTLDELGWRFDAALTSAIASGPVELIAGDVAAAEAELRRDHAALEAMGERNYISTTAAFLAEVLFRQGRDGEAMAMTQESERIAADDDVATQYLWRSVRAKLIARTGDDVAAEAMAQEAIAIIEAAQDPDSQGYAWIDLGEVRRIAGRWDDALAAAATARERFLLKGNVASAARAAALAERIERERQGPASDG